MPDTGGPADEARRISPRRHLCSENLLRLMLPSAGTCWFTHLIVFSDQIRISTYNECIKMCDSNRERDKEAGQVARRATER